MTTKTTTSEEPGQHLTSTFHRLIIESGERVTSVSNYGTGDNQQTIVCYEGRKPVLYDNGNATELVGVARDRVMIGGEWFSMGLVR